MPHMRKSGRIYPSGRLEKFGSNKAGAVAAVPIPLEFVFSTTNRGIPCTIVHLAVIQFLQTLQFAFIVVKQLGHQVAMVQVVQAVVRVVVSGCLSLWSPWASCFVCVLAS